MVAELFNFVCNSYKEKNIINTTLENLCTIDTKKLFIIKDEEGNRLNIIIEYLTKNKIHVDFNKIELIIKLFQSKYAPKKLIDMNDKDILDKDIFEQDINKIIYHNLKLYSIYLFGATFYILFEHFQYIKNKKYIFIIILLIAIMGIICYTYSINYIDKEWKYINLLSNKIEEIKKKNIAFDKVIIYTKNDSYLELFKTD